MESLIPQNIIIGPFFVNTDLVRLALGRKHKDIALALLKYLVDSLREETVQVRKAFSSMFIFSCYESCIKGK